MDGQNIVYNKQINKQIKKYAKINRLKKQADSKLKGFVVDDDDVDYEDEGENSSDELDDLD